MNEQQYVHDARIGVGLHRHRFKEGGYKYYDGS